MAAACVEELTHERSPATVNQHLAALRMLFDWLVTGQILPFNPTRSIRERECQQGRRRDRRYPNIVALECRALHRI